MSYPFVFIPAAGYGASCWFGAVKSSHFLLCQTKVICLAVAPCRILQGCHFRGWKSWWLDADVWCGLLIFGGMVHESSSSWHSSQANRPWDWTHSNISPGTLVMEFWDTRRFAMHNPPDISPCITNVGATLSSNFLNVSTPLPPSSFILYRPGANTIDVSRPKPLTTLSPNGAFSDLGFDLRSSTKGSRERIFWRQKSSVLRLICALVRWPKVPLFFPRLKAAW